MQKRTKIVATLGPATDDPAVLKKMIQNGLDVVRVNFSHGPAEQHRARVMAVHECAEQCGKAVGVMADLQGPKVRVARFVGDEVFLQPGQRFILDAKLDDDAGDETQVGIDYKELPKDVKKGDTLLLDDGHIRLQVMKVSRHKVFTEVVVGGRLSNHKGINLLGGGLSAPAITEKDKKDLKTAVDLDVDYIALSFVRNAEDVEYGRKLIRRLKGNAGIIAKIERVEAVEAVDEIIQAADGIMVARGDLAVEIGDVEVPAVQKHIIKRARTLVKPVITATQMMESMIQSRIPTRAEVSDVANAILDGTDAVMLSAETAVGDHPDVVIETVARACIAVEKHPGTLSSSTLMDRQFTRRDEAVAMATMFTANRLNIRAIIALTESGATPLWMSRVRTGIPIYALSRHSHTQGRVALYRDVYPISFDVTKVPHASVNKAAVQELVKRGLAKRGDLVILTKGDYLGVHGGANAMKILEVGNVF